MNHTPTPIPSPTDSDTARRIRASSGVTLGFDPKPWGGAAGASYYATVYRDGEIYTSISIYADGGFDRSRRAWKNLTESEQAQVETFAAAVRERREVEPQRVAA